MLSINPRNHSQAGPQGFEPRQAVLKTAVLPLHHRPMLYIITYF